MTVQGLAPVAALAFAALAGASCVPREDGASLIPEPIEVGGPAPDYAATTLGGDSVSLASQRGKVVLLNIWATWCHPCRDEIPVLQQLHQEYHLKGLQLVGVSVDADGSDDVIVDFMQRYGMTYAVWRDPGERVSAQFLVFGVPATFLIDRQGVVRWKATSAIKSGDTTLTKALVRALDAPAS